jgi:threonine dehydrogenase-like Zn-dependent dehydrogenase
MGLLLGLALKERGIGDVVVVEPSEARRDLAVTLGMSALTPGDPTLAGMRRAVDYVSYATGRPAVVTEALDYVASGGTLHVFGVCPQNAKVEVSPFDVFRRQLRIVGSHSLNHNIPASLNMLRALEPHLDRLVSHRMTLDEMGDVFRGELPGNALKVQVTLCPDGRNCNHCRV